MSLSFFQRIKSMGFTDKRLADLTGSTEEEISKKRSVCQLSQYLKV